MNLGAPASLPASFDLVHLAGTDAGAPRLNQLLLFASRCFSTNSIVA